MCLCERESVCVCVCERERERVSERDRERARERERERETHCHGHLPQDVFWDGPLDPLLQLLSTRPHQLHGDEHVRLDGGGEGTFSTA